METPVQFQYGSLDEYKRAALAAARCTLNNVAPFGVHVHSGSIGESVQVWEDNGSTHAMVLEGLGTESIAADGVDDELKDSRYYAIGISSVAVMANDFATCGGQPLIMLAYSAVQNGEWFSYRRRYELLIEGLKRGASECSCAWVGGETPGLKGIIEAGTVDIAGAMYGRCYERPVGEEIESGDRIILLGSNGPHDNGFTDFRAVAAGLPEGYRTLVAPGLTYGDALLTPTTIYVAIIRALVKMGVPIHYLINVTGHGWRKMMRATPPFSYVFEAIPVPQPIFPFVQERAGYTIRQMYASYNMGAGFALVVPSASVDVIMKMAVLCGIKCLDAGYVETGAKSVHILPIKVGFSENELDIR